MYEQFYSNPYANPYQPASPLAGIVPRQEKPKLPEITPEQESSYLSQLGGKLLSGVGYLGSSLDKAFGGRALRGLLGGKPQELLSAIPFSDTIGLTDESNKVEGKDLLHNVGLIDKNNDSWLNTGLGMAADLALDPGTYLTFGAAAANPLGKAAIKAGVMPRNAAGRLAGVAGDDAVKLAAQVGKPVEEVLGKRLGGHFGLQIPFTNLATDFNVTKPMEIAGKVADTVGPWVPGYDMAKTVGSLAKKGADVAGRHLTSLFDNDVMGATSKFGQDLARGNTKKIDELKNLYRGKFGELVEEGSKIPGFLDQDGARMYRQVLEGNFPGQVDPAVLSIATRQKALQKELLEKLQAAGVPDRELEDIIDYAARSQTITDKNKNWLGSQQLLPADAPGRERILKGLPTEGKNSLNEMTRSPELRAMNPLERADVIRHQYLGGSDKVRTQLQDMRKLESDFQAALAAGDDTAANRLQATLKTLAPEWDGKSRLFGRSAEGPTRHLTQLMDEEAKFVQANHLADWVGKIPAEHSEMGIGFFDNHPLADFKAKLMRDSERIIKAEGLHSGIAQVAKPLAQATADDVPLLKVLEDSGLTMNIGHQTAAATDNNGLALAKWFAEGNPNDPWVQELAQNALKAQPPSTGAMTATVEAMKKAGFPINSAEDLRNFVVPKDVARDFANFTRAATTPEGLKPFLAVWDGFTNLTKALQTTLWPANHARNQSTAIFQNWITDAFDPNAGPVMKYIKPWLDAKAWREGKVISGANQIGDFANLTDEAATQALSREIAALNVAGRHQTATSEVIGEGLVKKAQKLQSPVGPQGEGFIEGLKPLKDVKLNPLNPETYKQVLGVKGAFGNNVDTFGGVKAGRNVQTYLDDVNRVSSYIAKRKQGYTPEAALAEVKRAHFDFANLTPFESGVMRRAIPFYSWMKNAIPSVIGELAQRPGGKLGTTIKGISKLDDKEGFTPEYLSKGIALPIGGEENGTQRYLSSLGLPLEDLGSMFNPKGFSRTLEQMLGNLNPLIKAPLEYATGKQFYSGRDLADLSSQGLTGLSPIDQLLMNSPASRALTTARTLGDERKSIFDKALNVLTGARVTDVDMNKQRQFATRDFIEDYFRGNPNVGSFERLYPRQDRMQDLRPEEIMLLQLYEAQKKRQQEQVKLAKQA